MDQIVSKENKWVKDFAKLNSSKSYRDERGFFAVEGVKLLLESFASGIKFEMVFVTQMCYDKNISALEKLLQGNKWAIIPEEISKRISSQITPQGIYAICQKPDNSLTTEEIIAGGQYIMLCDLQDTGNVGTIIRTAEAIGLDGVIVTKKTVDIFNNKVLRGSMGSVFRVKIMLVADELELLKELSQGGVTTYASVLDSSAMAVGEFEFSNRSVLLIGNEGNGLSSEVIAHAKEKMTIKMAGKTESLNASMASCIMMWEMTKKVKG